MAVWQHNPSDKKQGSLSVRRLLRFVAVVLSVVVLPVAFVMIGVNQSQFVMNGRLPSHEPAGFVLGGVSPSVDCVAALDGFLFDHPIFFEPGSTRISDADVATVLEISDRLEACPDALVYVYGHADGTGNDGINDPISWKRANAVLTVLAQNDRLIERFRPHGQGAREFVYEGDAGDDDQRLNRRVEFEAHHRRDRGR